MRIIAPVLLALLLFGNAAAQETTTVFDTDPYAIDWDLDGDVDADDAAWFDAQAQADLDRERERLESADPPYFPPSNASTQADLFRLGHIQSAALAPLLDADSPPPTCDAIGFAMPEGMVGTFDEPMTTEQKAHYWACNPMFTFSARCTEPILYTHPSDATLSTPPGLWLVYCDFLIENDGTIGAMIDLADFKLVDAQGTEFAYRPFPIAFQDMSDFPPDEGPMPEGDISFGALTFMGSLDAVDASTSLPMRLVWQPKLLLTPVDGGPYMGRWEQHEVGFALTVVVEETYPTVPVPYTG